jgi:uncharacterized protein
MTDRTNRNENRGLAASDEKTRERVAHAGGEARAQDREGLAEAGRKGGETVSQNREHMAEIGRKGGQASHGRSDSNKGSSSSSNRGFASMSEEERKRIASRGGRR